MSDFSSTVDTVEMRHKRKYLLFGGIPEAVDVNIVTIIVDICHKTLQLLTLGVLLLTWEIVESRLRHIMMRFTKLDM